MNHLVAHFRLTRKGFNFNTELQVPAKGVIAVFGPSGSGKTTLLRCMAGLENGRNGLMQLGETVWQDDDKRIFLPVHTRDIGFVFQEPRLFPHLTVRANLNYGLKRTPVSARQVNWEQVIEVLGIADLLERRIPGLSLGEQQRVAIGRALLTSPRLLLMDEPLASLDVLRKREILPFIRHLPDEFNIPVVYVSHAMQEILQLADTLVLIDRGQTVAAGQINEVLSRLDLLGYMGDAAGSMFETKVAAHEPEFGLTRLEFNGHSLYVPLQAAQVGRQFRVHVLARNVSIALGPPDTVTSILNVLKATVMEIGEIYPGRSSVEVKLDVGTPLLASITQKSLLNLELQPGQPVYAFIKAVSLGQELFEI